MSIQLGISWIIAIIDSVFIPMTQRTVRTNEVRAHVIFRWTVVLTISISAIFWVLAFPFITFKAENRNCGISIGSEGKSSLF